MDLHHTYTDQNGNAIAVYMAACPELPRQSCAKYENGKPVIYLGHNERRLKHEKAHHGGMSHGPWKWTWNSGPFRTQCATVTKAGNDPDYQVGDLVCGGFDGSDLIYREGK